MKSSIDVLPEKCYRLLIRSARSVTMRKIRPSRLKKCINETLFADIPMIETNLMLGSLEDFGAAVDPAFVPRMPKRLSYWHVADDYDQHDVLSLSHSGFRILPIGDV